MGEVHTDVNIVNPVFRQQTPPYVIGYVTKGKISYREAIPFCLEPHTYT